MDNKIILIARCGSASSLKIKTFVATEYRQYATFSNYWRNLTVTSTLLTNYCKHSINPRVRANAFVSFILPTHLCLSQDQAMNQVYTSHMHQHLLYAILISFYFLFIYYFFKCSKLTSN